VSYGECPYCHNKFHSPLTEESHRKLYPSHFKGDTPQPTLTDDALPQVRIKRGRKR